MEPDRAHPGPPGVAADRLGRAQAAALGHMLREVLPDPGIDVVASPLERAFETATIIAGELGRDAGDVWIDERISDFDVGVLAGYPGWDAVAADHPELARLRLEDPIRFRPPGGESGADVLARAQDFLDERKAAGRDALVVCHGVINKFIRAVAHGITGADIMGAGLKLSTPSAFGSVYAGAQHVVWLHVRPFGDTLLTKCHVDA